MRSNIIFNILETENIPYSLILGEYDRESFLVENKSFKSDIDIVLNSSSRVIIDILKEKNEFDYLGDSSFRDNTTGVRVDLYFNFLNVGYYNFLKINSESFLKKNISEEEYIIYQLLDPLLKFSMYKSRHKFRIEKYFAGGIREDVRFKLASILGERLSSILLSKIKNKDFKISLLFIKICKLRLLFINGNFVEMLKSRIL